MHYSLVILQKLVRMGRKTKNTSFDQRQLVIFHREKGKSYREISAMLRISKSTVAEIIRRFNIENRIESIPQTGRPAALNDREKRRLVRKIKENPRLSAPRLASELLEERGKKVHPETIRRTLRQHGYNGRVARRKPFINEANRRKRLNFAKELVSKDEAWWTNVIFADESKFNIYNSDGRTMVWRMKNTELDIKHTRGTVKHGGGSVMVWGCISTMGVGNLVFIDTIMDKNVYLNLLKNNLHQSAENMGIRDSFKFYQDNDPKHKARIVQEFLLYACPKVLHPPPQSPDLNPIENLWDELDRKIHVHPIRSKDELKLRLQEEWARITSEYLKKIIYNMPKRLRDVIKQNGYATKY